MLIFDPIFCACLGLFHPYYGILFRVSKANFLGLVLDPLLLTMFPFISLIIQVGYTTPNFKDIAYSLLPLSLLSISWVNLITPC
jgi:hypothetical protein